MTEIIEPQSADVSAAAWPAERSDWPGRSTISTPPSPTTTAAQRRARTRSPSIGIASTVMTSGEAKRIA